MNKTRRESGMEENHQLTLEKRDKCKSFPLLTPSSSVVNIRSNTQEKRRQDLPPSNMIESKSAMHTINTSSFKFQKRNTIEPPRTTKNNGHERRKTSTGFKLP